MRLTDIVLLLDGGGSKPDNVGLLNQNDDLGSIGLLANPV
jgi:hypothetical protein